MHCKRSANVWIVYHAPSRSWHTKIEIRSWDQAMIDLSSIGAIVVFRFISFLSGRNKDDAIASFLQGPAFGTRWAIDMRYAWPPSKRFFQTQETGERDSTGAIMVDWFATLHWLSSVSARFGGECEQNVPMEPCSNRSSWTNNFFVQTLISYSIKTTLLVQSAKDQLKRNTKKDPNLILLIPVFKCVT